MLNAGGTEITIPRTAENRSASRRNPHFGIGSHPAYMMNGGETSTNLQRFSATQTSR
jgi:hypothetical protein